MIELLSKWVQSFLHTSLGSVTSSEAYADMRSSGKASVSALSAYTLFSAASVPSSSLDDELVAAVLDSWLLGLSISAHHPRATIHALTRCFHTGHFSRLPSNTGIWKSPLVLMVLLELMLERLDLKLDWTGLVLDLDSCWN
jgi:hypothetical protein